MITIKIIDFLHMESLGNNKLLVEMKVEYKGSVWIAEKIFTVEELDMIVESNYQYTEWEEFL